MPLTDYQRHLCRHALGLPNKPNCSYRNRFLAARGGRDYAHWRDIVDMGYALRYPWHTSYGDMFVLTRDGAEAILERDECLDPEDFP